MINEKEEIKEREGNMKVVLVSSERCLSDTGDRRLMREMEKAGFNFDEAQRIRSYEELCMLIRAIIKGGVVTDRPPQLLLIGEECTDLPGGKLEEDLWERLREVVPELGRVGFSMHSLKREETREAKT